MPYLASLQTVLPRYHLTRRDLVDISDHWLANEPEAYELFQRLIAGAGVESRHFALPPAELLSLNGLERRAALFEEFGSALLGELVGNLLESAPHLKNELQTFVSTSCSVPLIPAIDARVALESELPSGILRIPIYQHGCAGGVVGLAVGARLAALGRPVLVTSVELCSLVFQPAVHTGTQLVAAAIFADGAAGCLIAPGEGEINLLSSKSFLIPNTRHLMGYDIFDDGFHLRLDRALPHQLAEGIPLLVRQFLQECDLTRENIAYWLFHPGGIKILGLLQASLDVPAERCHWSSDVLQEHGNMSSATILFVIERFLREQGLRSGERALVIGVGPGLTIELLLLEGG